jgi:hypothetical protein
VLRCGAGCVGESAAVVVLHAPCRTRGSLARG